MIGLTETSKGCCGTGTIEYGDTCRGLSTCKDPSKYVFWDAVHPTQTMYKIMADEAVQSVTKNLLSWNNNRQIKKGSRHGFLDLGLVIYHQFFSFFEVIIKLCVPFYSVTDKTEIVSVVHTCSFKLKKINLYFIIEIQLSWNIGLNWALIVEHPTNFWFGRN